LSRRHLRALGDEQALLEHLLGAGEVLPARPGARADRELARAILIAHRAELRTILDRQSGRRQYQVEIGWDPAGALARFRGSPELAELGLCDGRTVAAGRLCAAADALARRLGARFEAQLASVAEETLSLPRDGVEILSNTALVLHLARLRTLEEVLEEIDSVWPSGLRIRLVGPLPPVSFAALEVRHASRGDIRAACLRLGVDSPEDDVDAAFRARARDWHPDAGAGGRDVDFARLRAARDLLRDVRTARTRRAAAGLARDAAIIPLLRLRGDQGARAAGGVASAA
jgi:hypothetical protein